MENSKDINHPFNTIHEYRPINWRKYLFLLLSNWYWFLITVFVALSIAYLKNRYTLPVYTATANLLLEEESTDLISEIRSVSRRRRRVDLANEVSILRTFSLHRRTIDSLPHQFEDYLRLGFHSELISGLQHLFGAVVSPSCWLK